MASSRGSHIGSTGVSEQQAGMEVFADLPVDAEKSLEATDMPSPFATPRAMKGALIRSEKHASLRAQQAGAATSPPP